MSEAIDHCFGLGNGPCPDRTGLGPDHRKVLEQEDAGGIGALVQGIGRQMAVDAYGIESGLDCSFEPGDDLIRTRRGDIETRRQQVGALQEESLTVDRADPAIPADLTQPGTTTRRIADTAIDHDLDTDIDQALFAKNSRPPEFGLDDIETPSDFVGPGCQMVLGFGHRHPIHRGPKTNQYGRIGIKSRPEQQMGATLISITAQNA